MWMGVKVDRWVCSPACMLLCIYIYVKNDVLSAFTYLRIYVCMHVFEYLCIHASMHVWTSDCIDVWKDGLMTWWTVVVVMNIWTRTYTSVMSFLKPKEHYYRHTFSINSTKLKKINVSRLVLQLSLPNPMKPGVKSEMKMKLEQRRQATLHSYIWVIKMFIAC